MDATDEELVRQAVSGAIVPFERLVDRYYSRCLRYAWRHLGQRADAEEVVQDTFLRAYRALGTCAPERFRSWLMSILVNRCRTHLAKTLRHASRFAPLEAHMDTLVAPVQEPDGLTRAEIEQRLATLSPPLREAFLLRHIENLSYEEIAGMTGVGLSAVKMRVKRAVDALQAMRGPDV